MAFIPQQSRRYFGQVDRYLIRQMLPRMAAALGVTLAALLIERILRLFDLVTGVGADIGAILGLAISLVPHYIGLALPAAFCVGMLGTLGALSKENEIDALENAGWSLRRIGVPFLCCGMIMVLISIVLFGAVQPYSRYAFYEIRHAVKTAAWDGRVEKTTFLDLDKGMTLTVGDVDQTGRIFTNVFLLREEPDGETVTTARRGVVAPSPDQKSLVLLLEDGQILFPEGQVVKFKRLPIQRKFDIVDNPFRERGESHRELTFGELWERMKPVDGVEAEPRFAVEFHGRLIRAFSLFGVALLSVPLGVNRKRAPTWRRIVIAIALLAAYDNIIKFVSGLGAIGYFNPAFSLWGLCCLFILISLWLYVATPSQGSQSPINSILKFMNYLLVQITRKDISTVSGGQQAR